VVWLLTSSPAFTLICLRRAASPLQSLLVKSISFLLVNHFPPQWFHDGFPFHLSPLWHLHSSCKHRRSRTPSRMTQSSAALYGLLECGKFPILPVIIFPPDSALENRFPDTLPPNVTLFRRILAKTVLQPSHLANSHRVHRPDLSVLSFSLFPFFVLPGPFFLRDLPPQRVLGSILRSCARVWPGAGTTKMPFDLSVDVGPITIYLTLAPPCSGTLFIFSPFRIGFASCGLPFGLQVMPSLRTPPLGLTMLIPPYPFLTKVFWESGVPRPS